LCQQHRIYSRDIQRLFTPSLRYRQPQVQTPNLDADLNVFEVDDTLRHIRHQNMQGPSPHALAPTPPESYLLSRTCSSISMTPKAASGKCILHYIHISNASPELYTPKQCHTKSQASHTEQTAVNNVRNQALQPLNPARRSRPPLPQTRRHTITQGTHCAGCGMVVW
jgi:hypothetical protein